MASTSLVKAAASASAAYVLAMLTALGMLCAVGVNRQCLVADVCEGTAGCFAAATVVCLYSRHTGVAAQAPPLAS
jgi:hypothetical protein